MTPVDDPNFQSFSHETRLMFLEREIDHLKELLADSWKELAAQGRRLERLERRLETREAGGGAGPEEPDR